jgi:hypothetical protein
MKNYIIVILSLACLNAFSQDRLPVRNGCDFLENLHFKNGVDTIVVKAYYEGYYQLIPLPVMKQLQSAKKLKMVDFKYALSFKPINCSKEYGNPCRYGGSKAQYLLDRQPMEKIVYLTCVVYQGHHNFPNELFYVIDKISIESPD